MSDIKVSVIVPVYNVEKYLAQCLDSIIVQTLKDIEIICVNDGSKDKSRKILANYAKKDSRIIIIDKKNGGLASARNAGMRAAKGEYIGFVDSDDWIAPNMYEKLYDNAKQFNSQIVISAVHKFDDQKKQIVDDDPYYTLGYFDESFDNRAFYHEDTKKFLLEVNVMAWNKIYLRSFVEENNAVFPDGLIFEDGPFFFSLFTKIERVSLVREFMYFYRFNRANSIIQKGDKNFINILDVVEMILCSLKSLSYFDEIKYDFFEKKFNDIFHRFNVIKPQYRKMFFEKLKKYPVFYDDNRFDMNVIKNDYNYIYTILRNIKNYNYFDYQTNYIRVNMRNRVMHKIMQILYHQQNYYTFKYKKFFKQFKKNPKYIDVWYCEDRLYFKILKFKLDIEFKYSELENKNK